MFIVFFPTPSRHLKSHSELPCPWSFPNPLLRHVPQLYSAPWCPHSAAAIALGGEHPPLAGRVPAWPCAPVQRAAVPAGHAGVGLGAHASPVRFREDQVTKIGAALSALARLAQFKAG